MNDFATTLIWGALQATVFASLGVLIYLMARRRGPATAALSALTTLMMAACICLVAFSPWPRWWNLQAGDPGHAVKADAPEASDSLRTEEDGSRGALKADKPETLKISARPGQDQRSVIQAAWTGFLEGLGTPPGAEPRMSWRWPGVAAAILVTAVAAGLLRLLLGLAAVARYRAKSWAVDDTELLETVASLRNSSVCARTIEVRESAALDAPATVGWLRPLILIPLDWRTWSNEERQAVLAHEVSHIERRDYPAWIIAQLCLALQFYNPLMHWLVGRLRLEQELAADSSGARSAGGQQSYLIALAQLALRLDNRHLSWAARPFLPTRGTLIRRIEMLRDTNTTRFTPIRAPGRTVLFTALAAIGLLVAGLRGPLAGVAVGEDKQELASRDGSPMDLRYVVEDPAFVVALRPAELARSKILGEPLKGLVAAIGKELGVSPDDVDEIKVSGKEFSSNQFWAFADQFFLRGNRAGVWNNVLEKAKAEGLEEITVPAVPGKRYYKLKHAQPGKAPMCITLLDDRTLFIASEAAVLKILKPEGDLILQPAWAPQWKQIATGQCAVMVDMNKVRGLFAGMMKQSQEAAAKLGVFSPLWEQSNRLFINIDTSNGVSLRAVDACSSEDAAKQVLKTAEALLTLAQNALTSAGPATPNRPGILPAEIFALAESAVKQVRLEQKGGHVLLNLDITGEGTQKLTRFFTLGVAKSQESAARMRSVNNLRQIALAMHNYHSVNGRFPAAAIMGPDGKTIHSWRVALLPFLDHKKLYDEYKFDEPWDSDNNRKVLAQTPKVFKADENMAGDASSYYALTGPDTMFPNKGVRVQDVTDGTSNTILVVEAKRDIPWTKPEDIPYDPKKPLPKFGDFFDGGFNAAYADGSVHFIASAIEEKLLRALITKAGGEVIPR